MLCDYESVAPDTVVDLKHCAPHINCHSHEWFSSLCRHVGPAESRIWRDATLHLKGKNTVYVLKLWDDEQTISKFAILNRNWRITDLVYVFGWVPKVLQNSLPLSGGTVYLHDIAPEVDIAFYQLYWLRAYSKAWEMHQRIWKLAGIKLMISIWGSISN